LWSNPPAGVCPQCSEKIVKADVRRHLATLIQNLRRLPKGTTRTVFTFLATLSFLFSLPGWEKSLGGFLGLSGSGGFLLKDVVLLGASLFTLGDSLSAKKTSA
jgi:uncharacterized membrane protein YkgB